MTTLATSAPHAAAPTSGRRSFRSRLARLARAMFVPAPLCAENPLPLIPWYGPY